MKKLLVSIAVVLFLVCAADAAQPKISPDRINTSQPFHSILMDEDANITLDGGWLRGASISSVGAIPETYGAVGDGVTDDTNAIKWALSNNSNVVLCPGKTYSVTAAIDPADWTSKKLSGYGAILSMDGDFGLITISDRFAALEGLTITTSATNTYPIITMASDHHGSSLKDIYISSTTAGNYTGLMITGYGHQSTYHNIHLRYPEIGINFSTSSHVTDEFFDRIKIFGATTGIHIGGNDIRGNTFAHTSIIHTRTTAATGIDIDNGDQNTFSDTVVWYDGDGAFTPIKLSWLATNNMFNGGYVEGTILDEGSGNSMHFFSIDRSAGNYSIGWKDTWSRELFQAGTVNLIPDGKFDVWSGTAPIQFHGLTAGTALSSTTDYHSSAYALKIAGNGGASVAAAQADLGVPKGDQISVGLWAKCPVNNTANKAYVYLTANNWGSLVSSKIIADGQWHWVQLNLRVVPTQPYNLIVYAANRAGTTDYVLIDDISVVYGPVAPQQTPAYPVSGMRKTGTATITAGQTKIQFSHGGVVAPLHVLATPTTDTDGKRWWISAKAATTATISISNSSSSAIIFDWEAIWD